MKALRTAVNNKKGFMLIEVMIVITILSLLAQIILTVTNDVRGRARDAKRVAEFRNFAAALEIFHAKYGMYPCGDASNGRGGMIDSSYSYPFLDGGGKPTGPPPECTADPIRGLYAADMFGYEQYEPFGHDDPTKSYVYEVTGNRQNYILYTKLEHPSNANKMLKDDGYCANLYEVLMGDMGFPPVDAGLVHLNTTCN
jgi:prepilin-type N-terminal cleavage/methylation domain-containing protein